MGNYLCALRVRAHICSSFIRLTDKSRSALRGSLSVENIQYFSGSVCKVQIRFERLCDKAFLPHPLKLSIKARVETVGVQDNDALVVQIVFFQFEDFRYFVK